MISVITDEVSSDIDSLIKILKDTKLEYVELRKINDKYLFEIDAGELKLISKKFELNNYKISLIDSPIGKHKYSYDKEDKLIIKYINICKIFKCKYLRIFTDVCDLKKYNDIAKENNIILLIENEKGTKGESYIYLKELMNKKYSNIKLLYDAENYYSLNLDYIEALRVLKNDIVYIHLRDVKDGKFVYLYDGDIDIDKILSMIDKDTIVSLETHLPMCSDLEKEVLFKESMRRIYE